MARERLYIVQGSGSDSVGLVGSITGPIAKAGGNIVDLRQDVLHGLFTIYMVVDLSSGELRIEGLQKMLTAISEDTGLEMTVDKYVSKARSPEKKNMLMILVGSDHPGIIASASETLSKYNINIEFAQSIGREGMFLTELLTDISHCTIPIENAQNTLRDTMAKVGIKTIFQTEDAFNKRKRVILFHVPGSLIDTEQFSENLGQTGLHEGDLAEYRTATPVESLNTALSHLEDFPVDAMTSVAESVRVSPGTAEFLQTLKIMGYKICLVTNALSTVANVLKRKLDIDHCYGAPVEIDEDSKCFANGVSTDAFAGQTIENVITSVVAIEGIAREDATVIDTCTGDAASGIHIEFGLEILLDYFNKKIISKDNLIGVLGSFGIPG